MVHFLVYNKNSGQILRTGVCQPRTFHTETKNPDECVMKTNGQIDDIKNKIVNGQIVSKTSAEIERDYFKPEPKPYEEFRAKITNEQYQSILRRLENLENK